MREFPPLPSQEKLRDVLENLITIVESAKAIQKATGGKGPQEQFIYSVVRKSALPGNGPSQEQPLLLL